MGERKRITKKTEILTAQEMARRARRKAARLRKNEAEKIINLQCIAIATGMMAQVKASHIFSLPEIRELILPREYVPFLVPTLKVFEEGTQDEDVPLVLIDIIVGGKIFTIDLAKLNLSKKHQAMLSSTEVLPEGYFEEIKSIASETMQGDYSDPGMLCYKQEEEYIPTSSPN